VYVPLPAETGGDATISGLTNDALAIFGGAFDRNGRAIDAGTLASNGKFTAVRPRGTEYVVDMADGGSVRNRWGDPLKIDLAGVARRSLALRQALIPTPAGEPELFDPSTGLRLTGAPAPGDGDDGGGAPLGLGPFGEVPKSLGVIGSAAFESIAGIPEAIRETREKRRAAEAAKPVTEAGPLTPESLPNLRKAEQRIRRAFGSVFGTIMPDDKQ
jgi:hypothetical protein